jgi:hypothetical protein
MMTSNHEYSLLTSVTVCSRADMQEKQICLLAFIPGQKVEAKQLQDSKELNLEPSSPRYDALPTEEWLGTYAIVLHYCLPIPM